METMPQQKRDLARCYEEVARAEELIRAGHPDIAGLTLALYDWRREAAILLAQEREVSA